MKKLILLVLFCLSGCTALQKISSLTPSTFNSTEYNDITSVRISLAQTTCTLQSVTNVDTNITNLLFYSQGLVNNDEIIEMEQELKIMSSELVKRYQSTTVSPTFCQEKIKIMARSATTIQKSIGAK
jgi:hypothetical protein